MKIQRVIKKDFKRSLIAGRVSVLMGARRVGKTTLVKEVVRELKMLDKQVEWLNCDDPMIRQKLNEIELNGVKNLFGMKKLLVFDEAQRVKNIGLLLKMIVDEMPDKLVIATGSSSFELANQLSEPLTGRKKTFELFPISVLELQLTQLDGWRMSDSVLEQLMRFGSYPDVLSISDELDKEEYLLELASDYLYKDALEYQEVRNAEQLRKLLVALALQIGQEVSLSELANIVGIDQKTVIRYLDLLEKSRVIFRLSALNRNMRKEIAKSRKIYFYDLGVRNALIKNFNSYELRSDRGQVWENFLLSERIKRDRYLRQLKNYYFWRTYDQKEIDLVEEWKGEMRGFEFKWKKNKFKKPMDFLKSYIGSQIELVNLDNYLEFVGKI